jgi:hypothetical protein
MGLNVASLTVPRKQIYIQETIYLTTFDFCGQHTSDCGLQKGNGVFQQYNLQTGFFPSDCLKAALIILNSSCTADTAKTLLFPFLQAARTYGSNVLVVA